MSIDPSLWISKLHPLELLQQEESGYGEKWTWTAGGCFAFAEAFQAAFGGDFHGVCRVCTDDGFTDYPVDHALVMLDGILYDHDGPYDIGRLQPDQVIRHRDDDYVCWFEDDFFDDDQFEEIHSILRECAAAYAGTAVLSRK